MIIDTHAHLDVEDFADDLDETVIRAREVGVGKIFLPGIDLKSVSTVLAVCRRYPDICYPMIGLQPEEVRDDYREVLAAMHSHLLSSISQSKAGTAEPGTTFIAIGEVGLDFYWSRDYERQQLVAFEEAVRWSVETQLPLMIHCRKAQNEMLHIMRPYEKELPGGVFHCFTGNQKEAEAFLRFERFALGIGGVSTFKSSHLREDLPAAVPLNRIVLETDSPYMAPVPHRGKRNESSFIIEVMRTLAMSYGIEEEEIARQTNLNVERIFGISAGGHL
ncbi:MAG: TatD family hydrolase [Prevotella sp.]|nr:TatD family hydrolase [Prevotella sp.]